MDYSLVCAAAARGVILPPPGGADAVHPFFGVALPFAIQDVELDWSFRPRDPPLTAAAPQTTSPLRAVAAQVAGGATPAAASVSASVHGPPRSERTSLSFGRADAALEGGAASIVKGICVVPTERLRRKQVAFWFFNCGVTLSEALDKNPHLTGPLSQLVELYEQGLEKENM
jgi:hypothetical protein